MTQDPHRSFLARAVNGVTLGRWPLLTLGLAILGVAAYVTGDAADLIPVGAVLVGAGIVLVAWGHPDPTGRDPRLRTRAGDTPRDTPWIGQTPDDAT